MNSTKQTAVEKLKRDNLELKKKVQQHTEELLQKHRELQIEAALEKVRSVAMSMKQPQELIEVAELLRKEMGLLGVEELETCSIYIIQNEHKKADCWYAIKDVRKKNTKLVSDQMSLVLTDTWVGKEMWKFHQSAKKRVSIIMKGERRRAWINYCAQHSKILKDYYGNEIPERTYHLVKFKGGYMGAASPGAISNESWDLLKRAALVFSLAYTRFNELQDAAARTRKVQIDLALERIRAAAMAMRNSTELGSIIYKLNGELTKLDAKLDRCFIMIVHPENKGITWWLAGKEGLLAENGFFIQANEHPTHIMYLENCKKRKKKWHYVFEGKEKRDWDKFGFTKTELSRLPEFIKKDMAAVKKVHLSGSSDQFGSLVTGSFEPLPEEQQEIISRFAVAFNQAYIRFLDLQKAEAQARESQIQLALERVRARTMAMHKSDELPETSHLLFEQMKALGEPVEQLTIGIINEENRVIEISATLLGDTLKKIYNHSIDEPYMMAKVYKAWKQHQKTVVIELRGEELNAYNKFRNELTNSNMFPTNAGKEDRRIVYAAFFSKGMLALGSNETRPPESLQLLEKFASVFDLTYTRFLDLQKAEAQALRAEQDLIAIKEAKQKAEEALTELQATQKQLIQSEKMASLGELTAGIAHERQNPLNFVNNFSEVSGELIKELVDEVDKGNTEEVKLIADDLIGNLEKINHHGKRAADIVKGMLQHSRTSSGQKELTDINALTDEYLRLAYHGLRAKDKSFNAKFETSLDKNIGKINIMPQEIGRVVLNLINNAFYAVNERKKLNESAYEPRVTITTQKENDKIKLTVADNGTGIPKKALDKIFQPFFTTKPTGQGTGLGLSLSYDIVKAHGGELRVETKEGEGTSFIIVLLAA